MAKVLQANRFGYVRDEAAIDGFKRGMAKPFLAQQNAGIRNSGKGKRVLLWKAYEAVTGQPFKCHEQEIGDCVSHGFTLGAEVLATWEIHVLRQREKWLGKFSTEVTYGLSRVEIGGGRIRGDGSTGAWGSLALTRYGVIRRGVYGSVDLSRYRPDLAKRFGDQGVPDDLETIAKERPVKTATLCTSYSQAIDAMANGYPVVVCSNRGFNMRRDRDGFLKPFGSWPHCMMFFGYDDSSSRKGVCIANSWPPSWVSGPDHALGQPEGCFWADASVVDAMLKQGDSYALSDFDGYPARELDFVLF